jgi:hypothetical protein
VGVIEETDSDDAKAFKKTFDALSLVKCPVRHEDDYHIFRTGPCKGVCFVTDDSRFFIHGRMAVKGNGGGTYPDHYLEMIDYVFGPEPNTIEACARTVKVDNIRTAFTVDTNPDFEPSWVGDAQTLNGIDLNRFNRYRTDPPYNEDTAKKMYGTELPNFKRLEEAAARVCKVGSLIFLLLGPTNYQQVPPGVIRVGLIYISVIPNNETRALNIYYKFAEADPGQATLF